MTPFHTEQIETTAGEYTVEFHSDDMAEQPYDEGFVLAIDGWHTDRIDIEHGDIPGEVWSVLRTSGKYRQDSWDYEQRSGAALVRYLTLKGHKGVTLVDSDYRPVEASSDRFERIHGVAWAPDDATNPVEYVKGQLREWRAWAEGDTFGWVVKGPGADEVASVWGYYGWEWYGDQYEYVMGEARDAAEYDASQRVEQSNLVGAGIVGIV